MDVRHSLTLLTMALAAPLAGCGGSDETGDSTDGTSCENSLTPYPGDCMALVPPARGEGLQVHYGPLSYSAEDMAPFVVAPGGETVDVQYAEATNEEEIYFNRYSGRLRPGSHHLIVSQGTDDVPDVLRQDEDFPPLTFATLFGSQTGNFDVPANGEARAPEEDGLAFKLGPLRQLSMNAHFINITQADALREAWFNVWFEDKANVRIIGAPIFLVAGVSMAVQPNTKQVIHGSAEVPQDMSVHLLFGHYHSHTVRFSAWAVRGAERTIVYEAYDYKEPPNMRYNSLIANPPPDPQAGTAGGHSGVLTLSKGDRFEWECEIVNNDNFVLTFANEVLTGEMCNLFGFYSPGDVGPWRGYQ